MTPPSAAAALRESLGDRKLPEISRKVTACVLCRKLKIKCHMAESKPPCNRCKARGLSCTINKSLQMLLENHASWKEALEGRIDKIEKALTSGSNQDLSLSSTNTSSNIDQPEPSQSNVEFIGTNSALGNEVKRDLSGVTLNLSCSLGAFPASSIINVTLNDESLDYPFSPDLISCGLVSLQDAEGYFKFYRQKLDPCIHHVLVETDSLADVRAKSSLLTAAICTVAAFCTGSNDYSGCLNAFKTASSRKLFSDRYDFDDVRALCIGAFWLNDASAAFNGLAVRIATELNLHRCITKMPHTKRDCYERTRLYFLVYLCDHHCSLIYGRPPMTCEMRSLKSLGAFLQSAFVRRADLNLISQVELWSLNCRVFEQFGADIESSIASPRFVEMKRLSNEVDKWYEVWFDALALKDEPDSLSRRVFELYFHSAKLYLLSHIFRGPSQKDAALLTDSSPRDELAQRALESALAVVRCAVDGDETASWLEHLPYYFGTMIAFACVCLVRASTQNQNVGGIEANEVMDHLHRLVIIIHKNLVRASTTHPLLSIAKSLKAAIASRRSFSHESSSRSEDTMMSNMPFNLDQFSNDALNFDFTGSTDWMSFHDEANSGHPDDIHFC